MSATFNEAENGGTSLAAIPLTWQQHDDALHALIERLPKRDYTAIVGIARSGLIPAVQLAHRLRIRHFGAIDIRRTTSDDIDAGKTEPVIGWLGLPDGLADEEILLVDDIVGSGQTLEIARELFRKRGLRITTCAVVVNLANFHRGELGDLLDAYGLLVRGWVVFPWCR